MSGGTEPSSDAAIGAPEGAGGDGPPAGRDPTPTEGERSGLVDFPNLAQRLFWTVVGVAAVCVVGAVIQGLTAGLTFAVLVRWGLLGLVLSVVAAAVVAGVHALGGARDARRRGAALSSGDVGLLPTRRRGDGGPPDGRPDNRPDGPSGGRPGASDSPPGGRS